MSTNAQWGLTRATTTVKTVSVLTPAAATLVTFSTWTAVPVMVSTSTFMEGVISMHVPDLQMSTSAVRALPTCVNTPAKTLSGLTRAHATLDTH